MWPEAYRHAGGTAGKRSDIDFLTFIQSVPDPRTRGSAIQESASGIVGGFGFCSSLRIGIASPLSFGDFHLARHRAIRPGRETLRLFSGGILICWEWDSTPVPCSRCRCGQVAARPRKEQQITNCCDNHGYARLGWHDELKQVHTPISGAASRNKAEAI
jgi:hypothetical protein